MSRRTKLDKILIVDLEASCWSDRPPQNEQHEIIQIGLVEYTIETGSISSPVSIMIKPVVSRISAFCTELTGITQQQADQGISFAEACTILEADHSSRKRYWASWGAYDQMALQRQCIRMGVRYPMKSQHLNVKALYTITRKLSRGCGLGKAVEREGLKFEGRPHDGGDDAKNVARVLGKLLE